ncbi:MAG: hypothetical protein PHZ17_03375 [Sulfurovum sp.]|nr:hypothetical protein [Sulfurovum sp.]
MNILIKFLAFSFFSVLVYFAIDLILYYAKNYGLPVLPDYVQYFAYKAGLLESLNIFLKIVIYGFIIKQMIAYFRSL